MEPRPSLANNESVRSETLPLPSGGMNPAGGLPQLRRVGLAGGILTLIFAVPLWELFRFAAASELYSYILLIPFISAYFLWLKRGTLPVSARRSLPAAAVFLLAGLALGVAYWLWLRPGLRPLTADNLAPVTLCFLLFFFAVCCFFCGAATLRAAAFPLGFLLFLVPLPEAAVSRIDTFLQYGSAAVEYGFFSLSGTPFLQQGLELQLPDISIRIASECSGIHSSLVLVITSAVAGYVFLRRPWTRAVFILAAIPLGIIRNGFRVFTIGELCIHFGPQMINSPIHHKGGPIFFALSLIPLSLLMVLLRKLEAGINPAPEPASAENPLPSARPLPPEAGESSSTLK